MPARGDRQPPSTSLTSVGLQVEARRVSRCFADATVALQDVDFVAESGCFLALIGPSGCGKTTLLRLLGGLDQPTAGEVVTDSEGRHGAVGNARQLSYCFQEPRLLPWRTVLGNVALPLEIIGAAKTDARRRAQTVLERVGLAEVLAAHPHQLSGGMRMRAALARALVTRPRLLLLDEPFAAVDEITRAELDLMLRQLWASERMTVVLVTHSISEAVFLANRVAIMTRQPGRIVETVEVPFGNRDAALRADAAFVQLVAQTQQKLQQTMEHLS